MKKHDAIIIIFLLAVGVIFFLKSTEGVFNCDDIQYGYCIGPAGETTAETLEKPISSIGDIFVSQYNHYFTCNGRAFVHLAVQFFTGLVSPVYFNIVNTLFFLLSIWLFVRLSFTKSKRTSPWAWLISAGIFLYAIEYTNLWYNPAFSINYLWTAVISMAFVVLWLSRRPINMGWAVPFAFFAGWQHEMFGIAISGALVIYYLINRSEIKSKKGILAVTYIFGALMVAIAPGSHQRLQGMGGSLGYWIIILGGLCMGLLLVGAVILFTLKGRKGEIARYSALGLATVIFVAFCATHVDFFFKLCDKITSRIEFVNDIFLLKYLIIVSVVAMIVKPRKVVDIFGDNLFLTLCLVCSCAFVIGLGIRGRAVVGVNLFGAILLVRIISDLWAIKLDKRLSMGVFVLASLVLFVHQGVVINAMKQYRDGYERVMKAYQKSSDGIVLKNMDIKPESFDRYVNDIIVPVDVDTDEASWSRDMFALKYGHKGIGIIPLDSADYKAAKRDDSYYCPQNEIYPGIGLYTTAQSQYIWADVENPKAIEYLGGLKLTPDTPYVKHQNFDLYYINDTGRRLVRLHTQQGEAVLLTK